MHEANFLSVTELSQLLNQTLESYIGEVWFQGELSDVTISANGHFYSTIKDQASQLTIVMWSSGVRMLKVKPEKGMAVRCRGKPAIYNKNGRLQVILSHLEPAGAGALQRKFEELKKKLEAEGLFAAERKRPIPFLPKAIGIVTSAQGAAIHDIMVRLRVRMPQIPVYLADVRVQGEGAAADISAAIQHLSSSGLVDVMIVGRGGGSLEDLWAFNEEPVIRAIFASRIPVISAVGHEVDVSLSDLVADLRAPTPTAAAEMVVPLRSDLVKAIDEFEKRLMNLDAWFFPRMQQVDDHFFDLQTAVHRHFSELALQVEKLESRLGRLSPHQLFALCAGRISTLEVQLNRGLTRVLEQRLTGLQEFAGRLALSFSPQHLRILVGQFDSVGRNLRNAVLKLLGQKREQLAAGTAHLTALNPQNLLARGYALVTSGREVITSVGRLEPGAAFEVTLHDGEVHGEVREIIHRTH